MNKIKPSFIKPLWIIRAGLYLLIPPFIFIEFFVGAMISFSFSRNEFLAWCVGYIIFLFGVIIGVLGTYNGTTFEIGPNSVSHNRNFLWSKKKEVLLTNIKEIELKSGFLQKLFGLGTIVMHTQASTAGNNQTGLSLFDLENANKIYESLKENISKATAGTKT
ncbi:MAG: PH domain-containing protein [Alphaproteobacteria bacterium]|nr:PH domain-containing protein [Alphaproteobacteria bacterium]